MAQETEKSKTRDVFNTDAADLDSGRNLPDGDGTVSDEQVHAIDGKKAIEAQDWKRAVELLSKAANTDPNNDQDHGVNQREIARQNRIGRGAIACVVTSTGRHCAERDQLLQRVLPGRAADPGPLRRRQPVHVDRGRSQRLLSRERQQPFG